MDLLEKARKIINETDEEMARLFVRRMEAVAMVAEHKKMHGLPILDAAREEEVVRKGSARVEDDELRAYYVNFIRNNMEISRNYQHKLIEGMRVAYSGTEGAYAHIATKTLLDLPQNGYDIVIERGALHSAGKYLNLDRKVLIVTDTGVPAQYAETVAAQCRSFVIETVESGEGSKSFVSLERLCKTLMENHFTRTDCVVAVGGGVVGDLAGFAAASYMRGIDFYNCPTTLLSQVDSSIGGKVAINLGPVKNIVGAFYQPKAVLIDPNVLATLPARQIANGLAEAVKMALTSDRELFELFESGNALERIDSVIERSLRVKKAVVEEDEKETGLRRILNFGHTLGHGVEAQKARNGLYHGECVALGMIPMCESDVRRRLIAVLKSLHLPTQIEDDIEAVLDAASHDKKCAGDTISVIYVPAVGEFEIRKMPIEDWKNEMREAFLSLGKEQP